MADQGGSFASQHGVSHTEGPLIFVGKVRDPLHDTIAFTGPEKWVINRPEFQRLRRIQQTAFIKYVFPGATHTRFEHALGVMHMSGVMLNSLVNNQRRLLADLEDAIATQPALLQNSFALTEQHYGSLRYTKNALRQLQTPYISQCLRFAALLHDVGHAPFSHSLERFMPTWSQLEAELPTLAIPLYLKEALTRKAAKLRAKMPGFAEMRIRHEVYTLFIIARIFTAQSEFLDDAMGQDVCAVIDSDVAPHPDRLLHQSSLQSLLHEIVSGEIDVDRMDYLLRDARQCGVVYGLFDAGRILDSAGFYYSYQEKKFHLALRRSGVAAFEDYLRARWSMYQQVYFHKTATACEAMLESVHKHLGRPTLPLSTDEYLELDDASFYQSIVAKHDPNSFALKVLRDLIFNRHLWKRVYEENTPITSMSTMPSLCPATMHFLRKSDIPAEMIESSTSLTRFSPKGRELTSGNSLRVIVKDVHGLRFLEPIENHSRLVNRLDEETITRRIFVARYKEDGSVVPTEETQRLVSSSVITPKLD